MPLEYTCSFLSAYTQLFIGIYAASYWHECIYANNKSLAPVGCDRSLGGGGGFNNPRKLGKKKRKKLGKTKLVATPSRPNKHRSPLAGETCKQFCEGVGGASGRPSFAKTRQLWQLGNADVVCVLMRAKLESFGFHLPNGGPHETHRCRSIRNQVLPPEIRPINGRGSLIIGFYRLLPDFTGFYWVLPGFTGFYWVLLGFT